MSHAACSLGRHVRTCCELTRGQGEGDVSGFHHRLNRQWFGHLNALSLPQQQLSVRQSRSRGQQLHVTPFKGGALASVEAAERDFEKYVALLRRAIDPLAGPGHDLESIVDPAREPAARAVNVLPVSGGRGRQRAAQLCLRLPWSTPLRPARWLALLGPAARPQPGGRCSGSRDPDGIGVGRSRVAAAQEQRADLPGAESASRCLEAQGHRARHVWRREAGAAPAHQQAGVPAGTDRRGPGREHAHARGGEVGLVTDVPAGPALLKAAVGRSGSWPS